MFSWNCKLCGKNLSVVPNLHEIRKHTSCIIIVILFSVIIKPSLQAKGYSPSPPFLCDAPPPLLPINIGTKIEGYYL